MSRRTISGRNTRKATPFFAVYYLWMTSDYWGYLGPSYPTTQSPSPLPANLGDPGDINSPTSNEDTLTNLYAGNQMMDVSNGLFYGTNRTGAVEQDCVDAYNAGLKGFAVNWAGGNASYNSYLNRIMDQADAMKGQGKDFNVWLDYKGENFGSVPHRTGTEIANDMTFFLDTYVSRPCIWKYKGKMPIVWTGSWDGYTTTDWQTVGNAVRNRAWLLAGQPWNQWGAADPYFDGNAPYWSTQDPYKNAPSFGQLSGMAANIHSAGKIYAAPLHCGYDDRLFRGGINIPRKNGQTLQTLYNGNKAGNPELWYYISWNEVPENSHLVALTRYGTTYQTKLHNLITTGTA